MRSCDPNVTREITCHLSVVHLKSQLAAHTSEEYIYLCYLRGQIQGDELQAAWRGLRLFPLVCGCGRKCSVSSADRAQDPESMDFYLQVRP